MVNMKNQVHNHVIDFATSCKAEKSEQKMTSTLKSSNQNDKDTQLRKIKIDAVVSWMNRVGEKADKFAHGICEHVRMGPKISETVLGKMSVGAKIVRSGGLRNVWKQTFELEEGEKLLKSCACYLSTTSGPIAGLLFITSENIAFSSERSLTFTSFDGGPIRAPYKVLIPLKKINKAYLTENVHKSSQKYIEIVTVDNFEFWFMGFVNHDKAFAYIQKAISQATIR